MKEGPQASEPKRQAQDPKRQDPDAAKKILDDFRAHTANAEIVHAREQTEILKTAQRRVEVILVVCLVAAAVLTLIGWRIKEFFRDKNVYMGEEYIGDYIDKSDGGDKHFKTHIEFRAEPQKEAVRHIVQVMFTGTSIAPPKTFAHIWGEGVFYAVATTRNPISLLPELKFIDPLTNDPLGLRMVCFKSLSFNMKYELANCNVFEGENKKGSFEVKRPRKRPLK